MKRVKEYKNNNMLYIFTEGDIPKYEDIIKYQEDNKILNNLDTNNII